MAELGDSLMLPKPGHPTEHLWVLATRPHPETGEAILVNVTTLRPHSDTTTILNPGDHPFVKKPSVVFYADARIVDTSLVDNGLRRGQFRPHDRFRPEVLARVQAGLAASPFTPKKIKAAHAAFAAAGLT